MGFADTVATAELVRPVDAMERVMYRYGERNPLRFMVCAELDVVLDEHAVRFALDHVQRRHPLLQVHVEDRPDGHLDFCRVEEPAPVPLRVITNSGWQAVAIEDFVEPIDRSIAPLMRAVLLTNAGRSALILTFDHTVGDGIATLMALKDVLAVLNGEALPVLPVPPSQKSMLETAFGPVQNWSVLTPPEPDARMARPMSVRRFDGTPTTVHAAEVPAEHTSALVNRCRAEHATVHAAIVTAASRVRSDMRAEEFVRVMSPINLRDLVRAGGDVAVYLSSAVTGMAPWDGTSFWDQARTLTAELAIARSVPGVLTSSAGTQQAMGVGADPSTAEHLFTKVMAFEMLISNLGVQDLESSGPLRPTALWAPVLETQIADHVTIGITTYAGVLRMVSVGYDSTQEFIEAVARTLVAQSA